jgi:hypothetical protein
MDGGEMWHSVLVGVNKTVKLFLDKEPYEKCINHILEISDFKVAVPRNCAL